LQQAEMRASELLRILTAFPLLFERRARSRVAVRGVVVGSPDATIGRGLWRKQVTFEATSLSSQILCAPRAAFDGFAEKAHAVARTAVANVGRMMKVCAARRPAFQQNRHVEID
jgi:hypothetical protein